MVTGGGSRGRGLGGGATRLCVLLEHARVKVTPNQLKILFNKCCRASTLRSSANMSDGCPKIASNGDQFGISFISE